MSRRVCFAVVSLTALLTTCGGAPDPATALRESEGAMAAGDAGAARHILQAAIAAAPEDSSLRIALARAELAAGDPAAAESSLRRALELGRPMSDVVAELARAILAQGHARRVIELVGDIEQWPERDHLLLALSRAEAELEINRDERHLIRQFVRVYRLRAKGDARPQDLAAADRSVQALRARHALVQAAYEHFACAAPANAPPVAPRDETGRRRVLSVGPDRELRRPSDAARVARDGDIVEIDGVRYAGDVAVWAQSRLLLRGVNGRPHLDAQGRSALDQGIWVFRGNDIVVENVEFSGARSRHRNGSGIRFFGRNLTIRDSHFHHNEDGVLTWKVPDSDILIERSTFSRNGFGDGQSHNIYIGGGRSFTLRFSHSHDSNAGHAVKSRAQTTYIISNRLTDEDDGNTSYLIDIPEGGSAFVVGNVLQKGSRAENPHAITFAAERPGTSTGKLWVVNNSFYNRYLDATLVRNRSNVAAEVLNNVVAGARATLLEGPGTDRHNFRRPENGVANAAGLDFSLNAESVLIDAGEYPGSAAETSLSPEFEYVHPASGRRRQKVGALDIGAYEFCGW